MSKTVLCIVPHPDDAEIYAGGTLAKMAREGSRVTIVVTTDGVKGTFELESSELIAARHHEMIESTRLLGAEEPLFLGYTDFELDQLAPGVLRERFIHLIRKYRPDVLVAEDPFWLGEPHPDHRAVALAAMEAVQYARLPRIYPQHMTEGLQPHTVTEKYFYSEDPARFNKIVDIGATFEVKVAALAAHHSQVEFLVDGLLNEARTAGIDMQKTLGAIAGDKNALFAFGLRMQASQLGAAHGMDLAEGFRYERFHPLVEALLNQT